MFTCIASTHDNCYAIRNESNGEVRVLKDCGHVDMDTFTLEDWNKLKPTASSKEIVLALLSQAYEQAQLLKIDGLDAEDPAAEQAFGELFGAIERASDTVDYYAD